MKRKKAPEEVGSLDSLLDTMTNVVGILIIIMVMTQLNISQTVDRIRAEQKERNLTPEDLAKLDEDLLLAQNQLAAGADPLSEKARLEVRLAQLRSENEALEIEASGTVNLAELKKRLQAEKDRKDQLEREAKSLIAQTKQLDVELAETDAPEIAAPFQVRMPYPRPPPEGAKEVVIICAYNRIFTLDLPRFYSYIQRGIFKSRKAFAIPGQTVEKAEDIIYDPLKIEAAFKKNPVVYDQYTFTTRPNVYHKSITLIMDPIEERGETIEQIQRKGSRFLNTVSAVIKNKNYVRFWVKDDSFEAYQMARRACDNFNIPTGWIQHNGAYSRWVPTLKMKQLKTPDPNAPPTPKPKSNNNLLD